MKHDHARNSLDSFVKSSLDGVGKVSLAARLGRRKLARRSICRLLIGDEKAARWRPVRNSEKTRNSRAAAH